MIKEILEYNRKFVEKKEYEKYRTSKYPNKKIAIVTCMDTRLVELLPAALGFRNGDVKIIKNAGGTITNPFDSTIRSLLVAIYELGVEEIMIIGHTTCGVQGMDSAEMQHQMKERGYCRKRLYHGYGYGRTTTDIRRWEKSRVQLIWRILEKRHLT